MLLAEFPFLLSQFMPILCALATDEISNKSFKIVASQYIYWENSV